MLPRNERGSPSFNFPIYDLFLFRSWLYMLIVAMDANFRLKSRLRGTINKEPTLGLGWSYFVDDAPYSNFIKDYIDQKEVCQ
jgi:hypothetical protein